MSPESELAYEAGIEYAWSCDCDLTSGDHPVPEAFAAHSAAYQLGVIVGIEQSYADDLGRMAAEEATRRGHDHAGAPFALGCEMLAMIYQSAWAEEACLDLIVQTSQAHRGQIGLVH